MASAALISLILVPNVSQILGQTQVLTGLAGTIVFLVGVSLMAFALAGIVRSTAGAITIVVAILLLVPLILLATDKLHGVAAGLVLIGVTFAAFLPGVRLLDGPKFSKVNFAPLFFIMGCMTIGSAGGFLKVTTLIANNTLPYLHGMTTTTAGLASYVLGALANFLLTPLAATTTMTSPVTELGIQMNMDPRILFYSFQYGLDNYLFPYEYAVILYFFSSGYMLFKDMLKVLAARMVLTGIFLFFLAIPYCKMVL